LSRRDAQNPRAVAARDDRDIVELSQIKEVVVVRYDQVCIPGDGALEDSIVVRVRIDYAQGVTRPYDFGDLSD
jgi:hypothetical protein